MFPVRVHGHSVSLREFEPSDLEAVHRYASDDRVVRFLTWGPNTRQDTERFLQQAMTSATSAPRHTYELAVIRNDTGELIGGARLGVDPAHRRGEIGYVLRRDQWGRGYGTEAASLLLRLGFAELKLHRIYATCAPDNAASRRVLEKVGMRLEGHLRHHFLVRGRWRDALLYAILEDEWCALPSASEHA